jgi:predicted nuclease of predicted toxin-antitoxin system
MKLGEYISSLSGIDPEFDKWFKENWVAWTPPKTKVKVFLDENLPNEFKEELRFYKWFRIVDEGNGQKDPTIYALCKKEKCLLITSDKDFWNDRKYPLVSSPGVIVISPGSTSSINEYITSFARFITNVDLIGAIRRFPNFSQKMKFRIHPNGFVHKFIAFDGKPEKLDIEY